ncbi:MAG: AsnC family transcriptional regulator, partial [Dehalococcoidia bacterium]
MGLDELDRALIRELQVNARQTTRSLAATLGVSATTVSNRVRGMMNDRVITFCAYVDPATLGFQVRVLLGLEIAPGKSADVAKELLRSKNVQTLSATTGRYDILVYALFHDNQELLNWITGELGSNKGVISVEEMTILKAVKTLYGYLRGERGVQEDIMPQRLDESALRLIKELELNPTESIGDLGKKTGMNRWMTARKLRTLLDEKVLKVVTIVDPRALGLGV